MATHAVMVRAQMFYKVYVDDQEDDAYGKTEKEIVQVAREKIMDHGEAVLFDDDTLFEPEADVLEMWYGYSF